MTEFAFHEMFPLAKGTTPFRRLTTDHVKTAAFDGEPMLKIERDALAHYQLELSEVQHVYDRENGVVEEHCRVLHVGARLRQISFATVG